LAELQAACLPGWRRACAATIADNLTHKRLPVEDVVAPDQLHAKLGQEALRGRVFGVDDRQYPLGRSCERQAAYPDAASVA
jgi:hypothetical protein